MALIQPATLSRISLSLRPFVIGFLVLVCLIPLQMVTGVIRDRISNHQVAVDNISSSWAGSQILFGPVLVIPVSEIQSVDHFNPETQKTTVTRHKVDRIDFIIPEALDIHAEWVTEERARGIHNVPVYTARLRLQGTFKDVDSVLAAYRKKGATIGKPLLSVMLSDIRGIGATPAVTLDGANHVIEPGSGLAAHSSGFHVPVGTTAIDKDATGFDISFDLKGSSSFGAVPVGSVVSMKGSANWPHPSFSGSFLPDSKTITAENFSAEWKTGLLATNIRDRVGTCIRGNSQECGDVMTNNFSVSFYQPVDIYTQSLRAAKYGVMFVVLTFAVFYITEILKGTRVYTMQLLMVGASLAIFYLLLVSLSEIIGFEYAYLAASLAVSAQLTYYTSFILKGIRGGLMVGGIIAALYTVLYFNLSSEDYALLIGSVLLFTALTIIMIITRNADWTAPGKTEQEKSP